MATQSKPVLTPFGAALAGALGGCFSSAVVYPLDVAKTQIQALPADSGSNGKRKDQLSMLSVILRIINREGISGLYKGFGATMLNTFSQQYAYFFFYSFVRSSYIKRLTKNLPAGSKIPALSTAAELLVGALAGALAQIFTIPVSVIATRQQVGRAARSNSNSLPSITMNGEKTATEADDSFLGVAKEIIDEEGVTGLWLGIKPGLVLTVNPSITYGVFERLKTVILAATSGGKLTPGIAFLLGAFSKTLATIVTYPYIMAKVRIQARTAESEDSLLPEDPDLKNYHHRQKSKHPGALDILARIWQKEGFFGWYQGMQAQIVKAVLSQALLFMSKDQFEHWALAIMIIYGRLAKS